MAFAEGLEAEVRLADIEKQCDEHGVGLIRMQDPEKPESHEIMLDPVRKTTHSAIVDGFLEFALVPTISKGFVGFSVEHTRDWQGHCDLLPELSSFIERVCSGYAPPWGVLRTRSV